MTAISSPSCRWRSIPTFRPTSRGRAAAPQLGQAIRKAVQSAKGNERVGILASGGLSHFTVDEELDRGVLAACQKNDVEALASIPVEKLNSGSSEIRNWIAVAGAAGAFEEHLARIHPVLSLGRRHRLRHGLHPLEIMGQGVTLERDPEKWEPVFGQDHAQEC